MIRLEFKSRVFLIAWLIFPGVLCASGLSLLRPVDGPTIFNIEVQNKRGSAVSRLVEETTSSMTEHFKSIARSILGAGKLASSFLEFLLGEGSNQASAAQELERLEVKHEAGIQLSSKDQLKLELLRAEDLGSSPADENGQQAGSYQVTIPKIIVLAPGQELLRNLHAAINQMANSERSADDIRAELAQIWNRANYRNQSRVTELTRLVTDLIGRVVDLRGAPLEYGWELETLGECTATRLKYPEFNLVPTTIVLGVVIFDSYLANKKNHIGLGRTQVQGLLVGSLHVSQYLMRRPHDMTGLFGTDPGTQPHALEEMRELLCAPGFLLGVVSRVQDIWNARIQGERAPPVIAGRFGAQNSDWLGPPAGREKIGEGAYATVSVTSCGRWAVKNSKSRLGSLPPEDWFNELLRPKSIHILPIVYMGSAQTGFELVSPYCRSGNLRQAIKRRSSLAPSVARECLLQILRPLAELEETGIVHGDIKSANLLLPEDNRLVLADFGLACPNLPGLPDDLEIVTLGYRAPEVFFRLGPVTTAVDVFAAGVIFWEMLTGHEFLYNGKTNWDEIQRAVMTVVLGVPSQADWPELYARYPTILEDSVRWRDEMSIDARRRTAINRDELTDKIGEEGVDLFRKMTAWNPEKRIKASEALRHPFFYR